MKKKTKIAIIICSIVLVLAIVLGVLIIPHIPMGEKLDMNKFALTFEDDFDVELDRTVWSGHYQYGEKT